ncbi:hypothetical protein BDV96DRAFT_651136 [Lophiotrema nucula]|uniref:Uncharacterized protein n=1 Tax=Lophiotrema nucula TaxID=690887 RepID=A0A6A5YTP1_9PLEO|nr:hypothetical protein BDV96DRAFT_651136 [Lophiotrema nucula]
MSSSHPQTQPTELDPRPYIPGLLLFAALATVAYQAIRLHPSLLLASGFIILIIGANAQTIHNRLDSVSSTKALLVPSGTFVILLSVASVLGGLICDTVYAKSRLDSCLAHFTLVSYGLFYYELSRLVWIPRWRGIESPKGASRPEPVSSLEVLAAFFCAGFGYFMILKNLSHS